MFQTISSSSSLTNLNFQISQLHSHRWSKRNITGLQNKSELVPSYVESTDYVPPISSSLDVPQFPIGNQTWKRKSGARIYNLVVPKLEVGHISLSSAIFPQPPTSWIFPASAPCCRKCSQHVFYQGNQTIHQPLVEMNVGIPHGTHWKGHTEGCMQAKRSLMCLKDGHDTFGCYSQWFLAF